MRAGKIILGMDALKAVLQIADDPQDVARQIANATFIGVSDQTIQIGQACGFVYRTRWVEEFPYVLESERGVLRGYFFEIRIGPNPVVDDASVYVIERYIVEVDQRDRFTKLRKVIVPFDLGEEDVHQGFQPPNG